MSGELAPLGGSDPRRLPTLADDGSTSAADTDPRLSLPMLHRTALRRAAWLADRLGEAVAEHGMVALVDDQFGVTAAGDLVRVGEAIRSLAVLEGQERDRAERIAATMARIGLEARALPAQVLAEAHRLAALAEELCKSVGLDWDAAETRRLAQRAVLAVEQRGAHVRT